LSTFPEIGSLGRRRFCTSSTRTRIGTSKYLKMYEMLDPDTFPVTTSSWGSERERQRKKAAYEGVGDVNTDLGGTETRARRTSQNLPAL
jgi:hypothetical protein